MGRMRAATVVMAMALTIMAGGGRDLFQRSQHAEGQQCAIKHMFYSITAYCEQSYVIFQDFSQYTRYGHIINISNGTVARVRDRLTEVLSDRHVKATFFKDNKNSCYQPEKELVVLHAASQCPFANCEKVLAIFLQKNKICQLRKNNL